MSTTAKAVREEVKYAEERERRKGRGQQGRRDCNTLPGNKASFSLTVEGGDEKEKVDVSEEVKGGSVHPE